MGHHASTRLVSEKTLTLQWGFEGGCCQNSRYNSSGDSTFAGEGPFLSIGETAEAPSEVQKFKPETSRPVARSKVVQATRAG